MIRKRFVRVLFGAALVAASLAVTSQAAPAYAGGYGCTGSSVGSWPIYGSEGAAADIDLYYDSGTGWNCAVVVKRTSNVFYGLATNMYIYMYNSSYDDNHIKNNWSEDSGMYKYYAGPVRVYGKDMCIWIEGATAENNGPNSEYWDFDVRDVNRVACD